MSNKFYNRKDIPNDEPLVMVRVLNSTPEPDGVLSEDDARKAFGEAAFNMTLAAAWRAKKIKNLRFKAYMLRVPPTMTTAREAGSADPDDRIHF